MFALDRRDWTERAACTGLATREVDPWCPDEDLPKVEREYLLAKARRVCAGCPVMLDCAADALHSLDKVDEHAMRGGMTPAELASVAKKLGLPYRREAQHGTRSKYTAGCTDGPDGGACEPCKAAHREYEHDRRLRAKRRRTQTAWLAVPVGRGRHRALPGQGLLFTDGLQAAWFTKGDDHEQPPTSQPEPSRARAVLGQGA